MQWCMTNFKASSYSDCGNSFAEEGKSFHCPIGQRHTVAHIQQLQMTTLSAKHLYRDRNMSHELFPNKSRDRSWLNTKPLFHYLWWKHTQLLLVFSDCGWIPGLPVPVKDTVLMQVKINENEVCVSKDTWSWILQPVMSRAIREAHLPKNSNPLSDKLSQKHTLMSIRLVHLKRNFTFKTQYLRQNCDFF